MQGHYQLKYWDYRFGYSNDIKYEYFFEYEEVLKRIDKIMIDRRYITYDINYVEGGNI